MNDAERDYLACWQFAVACLRAELVAGRKLTPGEMVERVERGESSTRPIDTKSPP